MITSFKSKVLKLFWEKDDTSKVQARHIQKIADLLSSLDAAIGPEGMVLPGYATHPCG